MRLWKVLVLLAGCAGIIGFFTPLVEYRNPDGKITGDASAYQMARDVPNAGDVIEQATQLGLSRDAAGRLAKAFHNGKNVYRGGIIAYFAPAALLVLVGVIAVLRDRMGRFAGVVAMLLAGACGVVFFLFWRADQTSHDPNASLGLGLYLLLGASIAGVLAGLGAFLHPDRGAG
jgi:hypothetical protein